MTSGKGRSDQHLTVKIETSQGVWATDFQKTDKVAKVMTDVIGHFGFAPNGQYDLRLASNPKEALKAERTLVSYGITDDTVLVFTELGNAA